MKMIVCLLSSLLLGVVWADFDNEFDQRLRVQCARGDSISKIVSVHDNRKEDRRFDIECKSTSRAQDTLCQWSE